MSHRVFRSVLTLSLAFSVVLALSAPGAVQSYGNTAGHPVIAMEALELVPVPELLQYQEDIRHGAIDEDSTDHVFDITCTFSICTTTHFWDADGTHGNGPGGPFDWNKDLVLTFQDEFPNAYMKADILYHMAYDSYLAGNNGQAYEYLGHVAHLMADVTEPSHAHEDYAPDHGNFEHWVEANYWSVPDGLWTAADALAAGGPVVLPSGDVLRERMVALHDANIGHIPDDMLDEAHWTDYDLQLYYLMYTADQYGDYFNSPDYGGDSWEPYGWVNYGQTGDLRPGYSSFPVDAQGQPNRWPATDSKPAEQVVGDYNYVYAMRAVAALYKLFVAEIDQVAPETSRNLSGTLGNLNWYKSDVGVALTATDAPGGFGVKAITYSATGAQPIGSTTVSGDRASFTFTAEGTTQLVYSATDYAGNVEASKTATVNIDKTPPTITVNTPQAFATLPVGTALDFTDVDRVSGLSTTVAKLSDGVSTTDVTSGYQPSPGVYSLVVTATDIAGNEATERRDFVIYDPNGGFVTGAGWLSSPAGAYAETPTLTGRATFGFVSKYEKGATLPTGLTEFQFKVADLNFRSSRYDWLVVAGARAQFKGTGTINGAGNYAFLLTAVDGQLDGGGGSDRFRIKIWDKLTDRVVYDNQLGAVDASDPAAIGGGTIAIHK